MSQPGSADTRPLARRAALAGLLGTTIEAYDFFVYTYLVVYTAPLFFPAGDPVIGILASLLVLGAGYLTRPLGGLFFGRIGDRRGRRYALVLTVTMMGAATFLIGVLPTFSQWGILAPILLVLGRLVQGFSAGGELMGSATYVAEYSSRRNRGLFNSITPLGFAMGTVLAPAIVGLTALIVPAEQMAAWGWRIPLLLSLPLAIICLVYRLKIEDSPAFRLVEARREIPTAPLREVVRGHWPSLLRVIALAFVVLLIGNVVGAYMPVFLQREVGLTPGTTALVAAVGAALALPFLLLTGLAVDRFGRRAAMVTLLVYSGAVTFPALLVLKASDGVIVVVVLAQLCLAVAGGSTSVPAYSAFTGLFPARVRYTGAAVGFGVGAGIGGGFGPYLAAQLAASTGNPYSPALLIVGAAVLGTAVILTAPNTYAGDEDLALAPAAPRGGFAPAEVRTAGESAT